MNGDFKRNLRAFGYGFAGLDIIKTQSGEILLSGGTCANVMSVLAHLDWETVIIKTEYSDVWNDYVDFIWNDLGVTVKNCGKSNYSTPRVIQESIGREHFFYTKCPNCNSQLLNISLPTVKMLKENLSEINYDIFYYDRISAGTRFLIELCLEEKIWTFYEPNSARIYNTFVNNVSACDIVKFSDRRISLSTSRKLLKDLKEIHAKTKIVIVTHESTGMSYSILENGEYSDFISIPVSPFTNFVDSSGAGDWLSAGFINSFVSVYPKVTFKIDNNVVKSALLMGHVQAEKCCSSIGALGSLAINPKFELLKKDFNCQYCKI